MKSPAEYEQWCQQLEERRQNRPQKPQAKPAALTYPADPMPIEIAPGRGDLNYSSGGWGFVPQMIQSLGLIGRTVSFAELYRKQPWVGTAVRAIMELSSRIPLKVYERTGPDDADRRLLGPNDDPVAKAIYAPWERGSALALTLANLGPLLVHGNSVTHVESGAGESVQFAPKDWRYAMPIMPWRDLLVGFRFDIDMGYFTFDAPIDQVLHVSWWDPIGPTKACLGVSPLEQLGTTLTVEDAAQRYQASLFQNGARPPSAIEMSDQFLSLKPQERDVVKAQIRADLTNIYAGPDNAGKPALLPPGLTWNAVGQTTVEAELINQRLIAREEVSGVYRLPMPLFGPDSKTNVYSRVDLLREMVYPDCIGPKLVLIETAMNCQIFRDLLGRPELFVEYDFEAVLRGTYLAQITALRAAIGSGLLTPNEGRQKLGEKQSDQDGMDEFYLPTNNLSPVGADTTSDLGQNGQVTEDRGTVPPPGPTTPGDEEKAMIERELERLEAIR